MTDRRTFLERVRERRQSQQWFPVTDPGPDVPKSVLNEDLSRSALVDHFTRMLEDVGGCVACVPDARAAREWVIDFVAERDVGRAVIARDVPLDNVADVLADAGVAVTVSPAGESVSQVAGEAFRNICVDADVGITGADFVVADTGTLVLTARSGSPRMVSLLPLVHIAVVQSDQFVANLPALVRRLRSGERTDRLPSAVTFITGPSRTGDIEQTLSVGVHGPAEVHVVVVG